LFPFRGFLYFKAEKLLNRKKMRFYEIPDTLDGELKEFQAKVNDYRKGEINPVQFKGIRVAHGVYEQRKENTHMLRIRCAAGGATPAQLRKLGELSNLYGADEVHVTTRMEMQLHYIDLEDLPTIHEELLKVGLSSRGGGGNTVRNIMSSYDSGVNPDETFDVAPYAIALTTRMISEPDSWNLPRKFKMAFSNTDLDNTNASITCLGFIAKIKEGKKGFKIYVAGGMGAKPMLGHILHEFVSDDRVYYVVKAIKVMFDKHGNRRRRNFSKLKFLWDKLGREEFVKLYTEELTKIEKDKTLSLKLEALPNEANVTKGYKAEKSFDAPLFETWKGRYTRPQKQPGLYLIQLPLKLGDIENNDAIGLANILENFGDNVLRCNVDQNFYLRNIPGEYLPNLFNFIHTINTLSFGPSLLGNMIACTGAATCKLGICLPRGVTPEIQKALLESDLDLEPLAEVRVHISGCPNTCGRHHAADLGFFGKVGRKGSHMYPAYNVLGGAILFGEEQRFAGRITDIPSKDLPGFITDVLGAYQKTNGKYKNFTEYVSNGGKKDIVKISKGYNDQVPEFDKNQKYYFDWGDGEKFSLLKGQKAECSAGVFDMINVDAKNIKEQRAILQSTPTDQETKYQALYQMVFSSARMLLVTRAIEANTHEKVFDSFVQYFIGANFVDEKFKPIVEAAKQKDYAQLVDRKDEVLGLCAEMIKLYESMDDSLRFNVPLVIQKGAPAEPAPSKAPVSDAPSNGKPDAFKDFRGVACPMNFVKTKLVLEPMAVGSKLEILLDDGEPIENVPRSVKSEGHKILNLEKIEDHWSVLIEKT